MTKSRTETVRTSAEASATDAKIDEAIARAKAEEARAVHVTKAAYRLKGDLVVLVLSSGVQVAVPRTLLQGLEHATPEALRQIEIEGPGTGLHWPVLGVDHYIPALLSGVFGTRRWMSELGKKGGNVRSPAKAAASRRNGRKGGRPRKHSAQRGSRRGAGGWQGKVQISDDFDEPLPAVDVAREHDRYLAEQEVASWRKPRSKKRGA